MKWIDDSQGFFLPLEPRQGTEDVEEKKRKSLIIDVELVAVKHHMWNWLQ